MKREKKREKKIDRKKARWWQGEKGKEDGGWKHTNGNELKKAGKQKGLSTHTFLHQLRKKGGQAKNRSSSARKEREKARVNACLRGWVYLSAGEGTGQRRWWVAKRWMRLLMQDACQQSYSLS